MSVNLVNESIELLLVKEKKNKGIVLNIENLTLEEVKVKMREGKISAIVITNFETNLEGYKIILKELYELLKKNNTKIIVHGKNAARKDILFSLISGYPVENSIKGILTDKSLNKIFEDMGYNLDEIQDTMYVETKTDNLFLEKGNLTAQYLNWLQEYIHSGYLIDEFVRSYTVKSQEKHTIMKEGPFLSVITRTQGNRPEALREMFLTLSGQSCLDFEVLLMGHKLTSDRIVEVQNIIDEQPEYMEGKIRLVQVNEGNRTTPLNCGFEEARGQYIVILDDDDLVLDNWVKEFKEKAQDSPGSILHAYVIAQDWSAGKNKNGELILRACGSPQNQYCKDFHSLTELYGNYCPIMSLAFPAYAYKQFGICFDETLDTTEDWDYLMRMSALCGVVDIPKATSIYRLWRNVENSTTQHNQKIWKENHKFIQRKIAKNPLILTGEYVESLMKIVEENGHVFDEEKKVKEFGQKATLYLDVGAGFNENATFSASTNIFLPEFKYEYTELTCNNVRHLRWDPYDRGGIMVGNVQAEITLDSGVKIQRTIKQMSSNGFKSKDKFILLHSDPQIYIPVPRNSNIRKIIITGQLFKKIPDSDYEYVAASYEQNYVNKAKKKTKMLAKRVIRKIQK